MVSTCLEKLFKVFSKWGSTSIFSVAAIFGSSRAGRKALPPRLPCICLVPKGSWNKQCLLVPRLALPRIATHTLCACFRSAITLAIQRSLEKGRCAYCNFAFCRTTKVLAATGAFIHLAFHASDDLVLDNDIQENIHYKFPYRQVFERLLLPNSSAPSTFTLVNDLESSTPSAIAYQEEQG